MADIDWTKLASQGDKQLSATVSKTAKPAPTMSAAYYDSERLPGSDLGEVAQNFGTDFQDNMKGLGVFGSLASQRLSEQIIPPGAWDPSLFDSDPRTAMTPGAYTLERNLIRPGDVDTGMQMGGAILSHYWDDYFGPMLEGNFDTPLEYSKQHPLNTALDVIPAAGAIGKLGKLGGMSAKLSKAAGTVANKIPGFSALEANVTGFGKVGEIAREKHNAFIDQLTKDTEYVKDAYNQIPKALQGEVLEAAELRDLNKYHQLKGNEAFREFVNRANETNNRIADDLVKAGALTEEEVLIAKYGPVTRSVYGMTEAELATPKGLARIKQMKGNLDKQGIEPTYMGIMFPKTAAASSRLKRGLFEDMPGISMKKAQQSAGGVEFGSVSDDVPSFLRAREVGERILGMHEFDAYKVWEERYLQGLKFLKTREFFADLLKNPKMMSGGVEVNVHDFFNKLGNSSGLSPQDMAKFLGKIPPTVKMPPLVAATMKNLLAAAPSGAGARAWAEAGQIFKTFTLGLDYFWMVNQSLANAAITEMAMWRSPRDISASFLAHMMSFNKDVVNKLPKNWFQAVTNEAESVGVMETVAKFAPPLAAFMEKNFGLAASSDNYFRSLLGLYGLQRSIEKVDPSTRLPLLKAFDLAARQQQIDTALANPAAVAAAGKEIAKWLGSYDALTAKQLAGPRAVAPFALWYNHALSVAKAMTTDTPVKNMILAHIEQQAPGLFQNDPELTQFDKDRSAIMVKPLGYPVQGPNGGYLTKTATGMTPFYQGPQLVRMLANGIFGGKNKSDDTVVLHPGIRAGLTLLGAATGHGLNPDTLEPWSNPHLTHRDGKQFDPFTNKEVQPTPATINVIMRDLLPRQEAFVRNVIAYPNKPTDFTTIGDRAIKRDFNHPDGYQAFNSLQQALFTLTKSMPTEQGVDVTNEQGMTAQQNKKVSRATNRQSFRTERD